LPPHWETRVWLDFSEIGSNNSLSTPHVYALPFGVTAGSHKLTIRVDNRMIVDVGFDAHSVTDHTQGNWRRIIRICKEHGLNLIRFHSWCPPEAAFIAADELGFYYQVECGMWVRRAGSLLGRGKSNDKWLYDESERIVQAYGNHPSFTMLVHGNEPSADLNFLAGWVKYWKEHDSRQLYSSATGWAMTEENQFHATLAVPGRDQMRVRGIGGWNGKDYREAHQGARVPIISHEIGQFTAYPDFGQISKYTGWLKPRNFEIFRDSLDEHGMLDQNRAFVMASGHLQTLCYKEEIEAALRTPGLGGYELLDLHDFPGQGTALIGVPDAFWDAKGYVTPEQYRRFAGPTVPLARLVKRTWTTDETLTVDVEISHFGAVPLKNSAATWRLAAADGKVAATGEFPRRDIPLGNASSLGRITIDVSKLAAPVEYRLVVRLENTPFGNGWIVWLYPAKIDLMAPRELFVASRFDDQARTRCFSRNRRRSGRSGWWPCRAAAKGRLPRSPSCP